MTSGIFLIQNDGSLVEMNEKPYDSEDLLQELLAKHPTLLAGGGGKPSQKRWLLIKREMAVPCEVEGAGRWSLDHLFLDQDAIPTLIEVKRSSDTRIRREVVGQMLDYAANAVVYWPVEAMRAEFEKTCQAAGTGAERRLEEFLGGEVSIEDFWLKTKTNLQAGRVRMIFVADSIPSELQRIVEFLNEQMDPAEVLAVEIKQFTGQGQTTLVPRLVGQTAEAEAKKAVGGLPSRQWDEHSFFAVLEANKGAVDSEIARRLLAWSKARLDQILWGTGRQTGSFLPVIDDNRGRHYLITLWTNGSIEISFSRMMANAPFDDTSKRLELLTRLNSIAGISLPADKITKSPTFSLEVLSDGKAYRQFIEVMEWAVKEIKQ